MYKSNGGVKCVNVISNKNAVFIKCEAGAITVNWVVITAMFVGLGLAVAIVISDGLSSTSVVIGNTIDYAPSAVPTIDENN